MLRGGHLSSYFKSRFLLFGLEKEKEREREFSKQIRLALSSIVEWHALMTLAFHWPSGSYPLSCDRDNKKRRPLFVQVSDSKLVFLFLFFFFFFLAFHLRDNESQQGSEENSVGHLLACDWLFTIY